MTSAPSATPPSERPASAALSTIWLFVFVVLAWSLNWVVMKLAVQDITPLWAVTIRTALAAAVLIPALHANHQLVRPPPADYPIVLVISLFHMVAFAALMTAGLTYVSAGRAIVLGYTTPLWVAPAAFLFLKERMSFRQILGIGIGMAGLLLLVGPSAFDWKSREAILGHGLPILAAICWSVSIVYTRAHRWTATPLQLMPWQCLLAAAVLAILALSFEGPPPTRMGAPAILALAYNGVIGTALGFWAMTVVNRRVPATTVALGVLATPVCGIGLAALLLGEGRDPILILSAFIIMAGLAIGTKPRA
ncbi:DMT family transporter [Telmatospirillum siberiense]|uniref:EamA family transporter n=1 Tax=Telmatospirillum siberiense TaxID=382514 RepID=A0A2N3PX79_9PROT|nr:DMT family transporter [Telmatospirillum siberiense]PKU24985.1 EamA family transporter [Telmatospirillum siberiense]